MTPLEAEQQIAWSTLQERFPWPAKKPAAEPVAWSMDYGGRDLITDVIASRRLRVVLEIGVFLGGSVRQWLDACDDVVVVAVDPWRDLKRTTTHKTLVEKHQLGRRYGDQLFAPEGLYDTFVASLWDQRLRVVPIRGTGIEVLPIIHAAGLRPDLIYLDADKKGKELPQCAELFPGALIGGDDWIWQDGRSFPIRIPAFETARRQGRVLKHVDQTWLIDDRPWTWRQRLLWARRLPWSVGHTLDAGRQRLCGRTSAGTPLCTTAPAGRSTSPPQTFDR